MQRGKDRVAFLYQSLISFDEECGNAEVMVIRLAHDGTLSSNFLTSFRSARDYGDLKSVVLTSC